MTTCVSGGICMSRSNLRLGASEGESDALLGKGSGSGGTGRGDAPRGRGRGCELAEQAVALQAVDPDRQYLPDDISGGHHMRRLEIGGAADDLSVLAGCPLEQHVHGASNRRPVEGRLL